MITRKLHYFLKYGRISKLSRLHPLPAAPVRPMSGEGIRKFVSSDGIRQVGPDPRALFERQGAYEGHGKTTVNMLNQETVGVNMVDSFAVDGFRLNSDTKVFGPCIVFPNHVLSWRVRGHEDITEDSLTLFKLLDPKVEVLVVGYGQQLPRPPISVDIIMKMKKLGIVMEIFSTENAIPVYNFLVEEGRMVAAALIPPGKIDLYESDVIQSKQRKKIIYEDYDKNYLGQNKESGRVSVDPYEKIHLVKNNPWDGKAVPGETKD